MTTPTARIKLNPHPYQRWQLPNVYDTDETGAMAIQKDPDWDSGQKYIYVYYGSTKDGGRMRLSRFNHVENSGGLASRGAAYSEKVLWKDSDGWGGSPQWHYGGSIEFGPDKKIYLTLGDKYTDWMLKSNKHYAGCIVRINKDGTIPPGNLDPKVKPNGCWAHGLRNGYSSFWDKQTNRYLIAEVGGNDNRRSWEDVHLATAGAHLGWPYCEGKCGNSDFPQCNCAKHDQPIFAYAHNPDNNKGSNACIIGGPVLRNKKWPAKYNGVYWHADFSHGTMSFLTFDEDDNKKVEKNTKFDSDMKGIISITKDYEGNLWVTKWAGYNTGIVQKITYSDAVNTPPTAGAIIPNVLSGASPLVVEFTSDSKDADGDRLSYQWIFGDGFESTSPAPTHVYIKSGEYAVTLFISDGIADATSDSIFITVGDPPEVTLVYPVDGSTFKAGETVTAGGFGQVFNMETNAMDYLPTSQLSWEIGFIHDGHMHPLGSSNVTGSSMDFTFPHTGHSYEGNVGVQFSLTGTTNDGLAVTKTARMWPEMVTQRIESDPPGLQFQVDHKYYITPFDLYTTPGFNHDIEIAHGCIDGALLDLKSVTGIYDPEAGTTGTFEVASDNSAVVFEYLEPDGRACQKSNLLSTPAIHFDASMGVVADRVTGIVASWADVTAASESVLLKPSVGSATLDSTDENKPYVHLRGPMAMLASTTATNSNPTGSVDRTFSAVVRYSLEKSATLGFSLGSRCIGDDATLNQFRFGASSKAGGIDVSLSCDATPLVSAALFDTILEPAEGAGVHMATGAGDGWFIQTVVLSNLGMLSHYMNGELVAVDTLDPLTSATALQSIALGVTSNAAQSTAAMDVKELLMFDRAIDHEARKSVERYLFEKHLGPLYSSQAHVTTTKEQEAYEVCSRTDDDDVATISCQDGYGIQSLSFVGYGTVHGDTCASATMGSCTVESAFAVVGQQCVGKKKCSLPVKPAQFGEDQPCFQVPSSGVPLHVYQNDGYQYKNMDESLEVTSTQCPDPLHVYTKVGEKGCTRDGAPISGWTDESKNFNAHMGCQTHCSASPDCQSYNYNKKTKYCTYFNERATGIAGSNKDRCYLKRYTEKDNRGEPIQTFTSSNPDACARACNNRPNCRFLTLSPQGKCQLYPGIADDGAGFKDVYVTAQAGYHCMRREDLPVSKNTLYVRAVCAQLKLAEFQSEGLQDIHESPTAAPTAAPTPAPTPAPTAAPTPAPTPAPTTPAPTPAPTAAPTAAPTPAPTTAPTPAPTMAPTPVSTTSPSETPNSEFTAILVPAISLEPTKGVPVVECEDEHADCGYWSSIGECDINPDYMHLICKVSCETCPTPAPTLAPKSLSVHNTRTASAVSSGMITIAVVDVSSINVGDLILVGDGNTAESGTVARVSTSDSSRVRRDKGTVTLAEPLRHNHSAGVALAFVAQTSTPTPLPPVNPSTRESTSRSTATATTTTTTTTTTSTEEPLASATVQLEKSPSSPLTNSACSSNCRRGARRSRSRTITA